MKFRIQVEYSKGTCVIGNRSLFADVMPVNDVFPARIQEPFSPFVLDKTTETDPLIILTCRDLFFFFVFLPSLVSDYVERRSRIAKSFEASCPPFDHLINYSLRKEITQSMSTTGFRNKNRFVREEKKKKKKRNRNTVKL